MTLPDLFQHWSITENPFRGEEARTDTVFARLAGLKADGTMFGIAPGAGPVHSDFEKILGDLANPSSAIVFGEKGSGKTAIRLQMADRVALNNAENPDSKVLLIAYDDLNTVLGRMHERYGGKTPLESFKNIRLVDHIDAILSSAVPRLVTAIFGTKSTSDPLDIGPDVRRMVRKLDARAKRDILVLQAIYDRPEDADQRTYELRKRLGLRRPFRVFLQHLGLIVLPVLLGGGYAYGRWHLTTQTEPTVPEGSMQWLNAAGVAAAALYAVVLLKAAWDRLASFRRARRIRRQVRVVSRTDASFARSIRQLYGIAKAGGSLPETETDDTRYALLDRFIHGLGPFGYRGLILVIDRIDEPTLVSGDPDRMKCLIWPMLNNKFLQHPGLGVKMLLPVELRYALLKESSVFFQEARLDKQSFIERLGWTGATLYDLCNARLKACRPPTAAPISLLDLFAEDVSQQDLVDALDQMHQPRDAFKFLYRCMSEHCSNVTTEQQSWRIPRLTLETVRKQEAERVQQFYRGIRPA